MTDFNNEGVPPPQDSSVDAVPPPFRARKKIKRNYWIDPAVQWAIIQKALLLSGLVVVLLFAVDKIFFYRMSSMGKDLGFSADHVYFLFLQEQERIKFWMFLATSGLITFIGTVIGIRFSHRLAGPIFRLKKEMRRLNDGEKIEEVNLRDADFFKELADEFNALTLKYEMRKQMLGKKGTEQDRVA